MDLSIKTLKRSAAVSVAALFAATAAHAADLPQELPPDPDIFNWTGPYVGGHLGYAVEGDADMRFPGGTLTADLDGILGGIYGGYNYQMNGFVLGGEADVTFSDVDGSAPPVSSFDVLTHGSVRLRAGLAYDRILPYLTVGLGVAGGEQTIPGGGTPLKVHLGVVAGAGIDWALGQNLSARVEYLYSYYGRERYNHTAVSSRTDFDTHVVRGGLSWHFGSYLR